MTWQPRSAAFVSAPHRLRPRSRLTIALVVVAILAAVFLPGPNGLIRAIASSLRLRRLRAELPRLEARVDSLERVCHYLADPAYASEYAARRLAPITAPTDSL